MKNIDKDLIGFLVIIIALPLNFLLFRFLFPWMISSESSFMVTVGMVSCFGFIAVQAFIVYLITKNQIGK